MSNDELIQSLAGLSGARRAAVAELQRIDAEIATVYNTALLAGVSVRKLAVIMEEDHTTLYRRYKRR